MKPISRKSLIIGILMLVLIGGALVWVLVGELEGEPVWDLLKAADLRWLVVGALAMVSFCLCEASNIRQGLLLSDYKPSFLSCIRYALAGFFFSGITPSASGGQPAQLYFMSRDKIHISHGSFSLMVQLIGFQTASVSLGIMGAIYGLASGVIQRGNPLIWLFSLGFIINFLWLLLLLGIMFLPNVSMAVERLVVRIMGRLRKKKTTIEKTANAFSEYRAAAAFLKTDRSAALKVLFTAFFQLTFYNSIPFFCAKAIGLDSAVWFPCLCLQALLFLSASAAPLPGASGVTEGGFALFFSALFSEEGVGTLLIISRCMSFVLPLIVSGGLQLLLSLSFVRKKESVTRGS